MRMYSTSPNRAASPLSRPLPALYEPRRPRREHAARAFRLARAARNRDRGPAPPEPRVGAELEPHHEMRFTETLLQFFGDVPELKFLPQVQVGVRFFFRAIDETGRHGVSAGFEAAQV